MKRALITTITGALVLGGSLGLTGTANAAEPGVGTRAPEVTVATEDPLLGPLCIGGTLPLVGDILVGLSQCDGPSSEEDPPEGAPPSEDSPPSDPSGEDASGDEVPPTGDPTEQDPPTDEDDPPEETSPSDPQPSDVPPSGTPPAGDTGL